MNSNSQLLLYPSGLQRNITPYGARDRDLLAAVKAGDIDKVKEILALEEKEQANTLALEILTAYDAYSGHLPIHIAAENNNLELVKLLIDKGADPLEATVYHKKLASNLTTNPELKYYLLIQEHETRLKFVKINNKYQQLLQQLDSTMVIGKQEKLLAKFGFTRKDIDKIFLAFCENDPLYKAIGCGNLTEIKRLIEVEKVAFDKPTLLFNGISPLFYAIRARFPEVLEYLISKGASLKQTLANGMSIMQYAATANDDVDIARILLVHGADVNTQDENKQTALHATIFCNNEDLTSFLLENGARIDIPDLEKKTAFDFAVSASNISTLIKMIPLLPNEKLKHYVVNPGNINNSLLPHLAIYYNSLQLLEMIYERIPPSQLQLMMNLGFAKSIGNLNIYCWILGKLNNKAYTYAEVYDERMKRYRIEIREAIPEIIDKEKAKKKKKKAQYKQKQKAKKTQQAKNEISLEENTQEVKESKQEVTVEESKEDNTQEKDSNKKESSSNSSNNINESKQNIEEKTAEKKLTTKDRKEEKKARATVRHQNAVEIFASEKKQLSWGGIRNAETEDDQFKLVKIDSSEKYLFIPKSYLDDQFKAADELEDLYRTRAVFCGKEGKQGLKAITKPPFTYINLTLGDKTYFGLKISYKIKRLGMTANIFLVEIPCDATDAHHETLLVAVKFDSMGYHKNHKPVLAGDVYIPAEHLPKSVHIAMPQSIQIPETLFTTSQALNHSTSNRNVTMNLKDQPKTYGPSEHR